MRFFLISLLVCIAKICIAQSDCSLSISGRVIDEHDNTALAFAEVTIPELNRGVVVDSNGYFTLGNLCAGSYTIVGQHIGCEPVISKLILTKNITNFTLYLEHHTTLLQEAAIELPPTKQPIKTTNTTTTLNNLDLPQLRVQQTGENVFKPIVRGFSGNRVSTYVGGVELQDQQWGTDHGLSLMLYPDDKIDVFSTPNSGNLGGLSIWHGTPFQKKSMVFASAYSNGLGAKLGAIQNIKVSDAFALGGRFQLNRSGDKRAPDYILSNTSSAQANVQIDAAYKKNDWYVTFNSSYDYKSLATLAASHVGNVNDFYTALAADEPIIQNDFSYAIQNPKQEVGHFITAVKASKHYRNNNVRGYLKNSGYYEYFYNYQLNNRKEFEARRGGNSAIPALNLQLQTHQMGGSFSRSPSKDKYNFEIGVHQDFAINTNLPGPSYEPILPNYNSYMSKIYGNLRVILPELKKRDQELFIQGVFTYVNTLAQFFENSVLTQENFAFATPSVVLTYSTESFGFFTNAPKSYRLNTLLTLTQRAPAPNELLISGVHHGTATIEEGNLNLQPETKIGLEQTATFKTAKSKTEITLTGYAKYIADYIYQIPLAEPRLTIRGAFPVFQFTQTNSFFAGAEVSAKQKLGKFFSYTLGLNYIYAQDVENDSPLPLIPPFEWRNNLRFEKNIDDTWQNFYVEASHTYTGRQFRFNPSLDLANPPADYSLLNAAIGISHVKKHRYTFSLKVENLTNQRYRNYLDRFRYFADAAGINVLFNCLINF